MTGQTKVGPTYEQSGELPDLRHHVFIAAAYPAPMLTEHFGGRLGDRDEDVTGVIDDLAIVDEVIIGCKVSYTREDGTTGWGWYDPAGLVHLKSEV